MDTESDEELKSIGEHFFKILLKTSKGYPKDIGMIGRNTIEIYTQKLNKDNKTTYLSEFGISVGIKLDQQLELSLMFGNVWVKKLRRDEIINILHPMKNHLQTCALLVHDENRDEIIHHLLSSGVVYITDAHASHTEVNDPHDGSYPLRLYSNIVKIQKT